MPYVAPHPELFLNKTFTHGDSVAFVSRAATNLPGSVAWRPGRRVHAAEPGSIAKGTIIATFDHGHFPAVGGHAAIYLSHDTNALHVIDQWQGRPVSYRRLHWHQGQGNVRNDGNSFYVIE